MSVPYYLFGCGGHGRSIAEIVLSNDPAVDIVFVDRMARPGEKVLGFPVWPNVDLPVECRVLATVGDNEERKKIFEALPREKLEPLISIRAHLGHQCIIGRGSSVGVGGYVGPEAVVGDNTILNTGCIVEHEVVVGSHNHIAPHVTICGRTRIGDLVMIGAGATVIDGIRIVSNVIVGAGATVVRDITEPGVYVGTPAVRIAPYPANGGR
ncbi:MAG TPA: acetyltransferase [Verrucomicrobia bacterium]|nr:acetyltransferase [Verrucomicrobiota bacterium]